VRDFGMYVFKDLVLPHEESGVVRGNIEVPPTITEIVNLMADKCFVQMESDDFCDELVDVQPVPQLFASIDWVPHELLALMGLRATDQEHLVLTPGTLDHDDDIYQLSLMWVLRADPGMAFRHTHPDGPWLFHRPGDWYLFDDRLYHEVSPQQVDGRDPAWNSMYVAWCIKLGAL